MMNKKLLFGFLLCMLMLLPLASAGMFPLPVSGKVIVNGEVAPGVPVRMYNTMLDITVDTSTDSSGHFQVDWSSHPYGLIQISALGMTREVRIFYGEVYPNQDIGVVDPNYVPMIVCLDGSIVAQVDLCPVIDPPVIITDVYICEDGTEVELKEDCSKTISSIWWYIIEALALVLGAFGWRKGFLGLCRYWWKKGEEYEADNDWFNGEKCKRRAIKMAKTAFANAIAKKYQRKLER